MFYQEEQQEEVKKPFKKSILEDHSIFRDPIKQETVLAKKEEKKNLKKQELKLKPKEKEFKFKEELNINKKKEDTEFKQKEKEESFIISYYNPVLEEEEVYPQSIKLYLTDIEKEVEESLAEKNTFAAYSGLVRPLTITEYDDKELEKIIKEKDDYLKKQSPMQIIPIKELEKELISIERSLPNNVEITDPLVAKLNANIVISQLEKRKQDFEEQIKKEIEAIDKAIDLIKQSKKKEALDVLPPLTRERISFAFKKKLPDSVIINMLLYDKKFLTSLKLKIKLMSYRALKALSKIIKSLGR